jgi:hypothetical protein
MERGSDKRGVFLLVISLLAFSALLYYSTIHLFPSFIHAWTQSDRYAIALRFLENGFDILHPETFNLQTVDGVTRVDLPLNEFIVAMIMKISGSTAPVIFRVYTLIISITGLVYLYLLGKKLSGSELKSQMLVLFVFFSPVYTYYQAGFIPSIPSIAATFAGYYYFFSYKENGLKKHFYFAIVLLLLAALMRLPFIIFLFAAFLQQGYMFIKTREFRKHELSGFTLAFLIFITVYLYNVHLGRIYGSMFLDTFMPARTFDEFKIILKEMYDHWCFHYFTMWHYILMFVLVLISVITFYKRGGYREEDKKYWFLLLIMSCGTALYFLIMARQFYAHDYYFLDSLFIPVVLLFILVIKNLPFETKKQRVSWGIVFGITTILFFISNRNTQADRYWSGAWDRVEVTRQNFTGTERYLDSLGVAKDARILVIDAYSTNIPLILMNRKGYTVMRTAKENIGTALQWCEWDYVAIQDIYLVSDVIKNYPLITSMLEPIGSTGSVSFYKKSDGKYKTLKQFLNISPDRISFSMAHPSARMDAATEFGVTASVKASELKDASKLKVLVSAGIKSNSPMTDLQLVAAISSGSEQLYYNAFALSDYFKASESTQRMEFQFVLPEFKTPEDELKIYFWNPGKVSMDYNNWEVIVYK